MVRIAGVFTNPHHAMISNQIEVLESKIAFYNDFVKCSLIDLDTALYNAKETAHAGHLFLTYVGIITFLW